MGAPDSSLEKLLIEDYNNEKDKKQQQQSPSYDALLLLLKFRRGQGSSLGKPEFFQAFFSQLHKVACIFNCNDLLCIYFCIINFSLLRLQGLWVQAFGVMIFGIILAEVLVMIGR